MNERSLSTNARLKNYSLLQALIERRSRRFAPGMKLEGGRLSFESKRNPTPSPKTRKQSKIAYCKYVHERYGRFPVDGGPFRTLLAY
jgi:hypothetical protein